MTVRLLQGEARAVLATLPAQSCHLCYTSPPYWRLRAYLTPPQTWADGAICELGSESTVDSYLAHLIEVFAAVKRVLRDDGTCWVNLGDSYLTDPGGQNGARGTMGARAIAANAGAGRQQRVRDSGDSLNGLGQGNLLLLPWRFGLAMQADGWDLRQVITYCKQSPLPESLTGTVWEPHRIKVGRQRSRERVPRAWDVGEHTHDQVPGGYYEAAGDGASVAEYQDCPGCPQCAPNDGLVLRRGRWRPTTATEQVLIFSKRGARYYADPDAVRDPGRPGQNEHNQRYARRYAAYDGHADCRQPGNVNSVGIHSRPGPGGHNLWNWQVWPTTESKTSAREVKKSVSHYASFPPGLPRLAVEACAPLIACGTCGAGWARVIAEEDAYLCRRVTSHGFRPTCTCTPAVQAPSTILDPFSGTGTTCMEADRLGRNAIGVELSESYHDLAQSRVRGDCPLFVELETEIV